MSISRAISLGLAFLACHVSLADSPGLGMALDADDAAAWTLIVMPDGEGLPAGEATAAEGQQVYGQHCIACHGADGRGTVNDALVGGEGTLTTANPLKTVGSYWPFATTVFDYIRRAMPYQQPGILTDKEVYAVTAYVLYLNGIIEIDESLSQESLPSVEMPNRDGFSWAWPADLSGL